MKQQAFNPFLPLGTYIPDGEPHVFGDRVYLYGSHDKEGGATFCMLDYEVWSAPIDDLSDWSTKGVGYSAAQDPMCGQRKEPYLYAPDCVKGSDGRFYLYYCFGGYEGPIRVAVCDTPDGKFEFYGTVREADGTPLTRFVPFDPAVLNDNGTIRLYYGAWYPFNEMPEPFKEQMLGLQMQMFGKTKEQLLQEEGGIFGPVTCVLKEDMLTVETQPMRIFPAVTKGTPFESGFKQGADGQRRMCGHGFYEGSSIRKIGDTYYFIYSSANNHELCYATSKHPDRDFTYRGVIISNGDVGYKGRREEDRLNFTGTNHGSIEQINGQWYVFYHRLTHGTGYSRQACAEPIQILEDGSIPQVEMTSCGLNGGPLKGTGEYPAVICCNLTNGHMPHGGREQQEVPRVTHCGEERYLTGLQAGTVAVYKYFDLKKTRGISLTARGEGRVKVLFGERTAVKICISSAVWKAYAAAVDGGEGKCALTVEVTEGEVELLSLELKGGNDGK